MKTTGQFHFLIRTVYLLSRVGGSHATEEEALGQGEDRQANEVARRASSHIRTTSHDNQASEGRYEGHPEEPDVGEGVVGDFRDVEDADDGHGDDQLDRQDAVNFPDEASTDGRVGEGVRTSEESGLAAVIDAAVHLAAVRDAVTLMDVMTSLDVTFLE